MSEIIDVRNGLPAAPGKKKRRIRKRKRRITLPWLVVILFMASLSAFVVVFARGCYDNFFARSDAGYYPRDIERQYHEVQKMKENTERAGQNPSGR
jgi:hypothetical protein